MSSAPQNYNSSYSTNNKNNSTCNKGGNGYKGNYSTNKGTSKGYNNNNFKGNYRFNHNEWSRSDSTVTILPLPLEQPPGPNQFDLNIQNQSNHNVNLAQQQQQPPSSNGPGPHNQPNNFLNNNHNNNNNQQLVFLNNNPSNTVIQSQTNNNNNNNNHVNQNNQNNNHVNQNNQNNNTTTTANAFVPNFSMMSMIQNPSHVQVTGHPAAQMVMPMGTTEAHQMLTLAPVGSLTLTSNGNINGNNNMIANTNNMIANNNMMGTIVPGMIGIQTLNAGGGNMSPVLMSTEGLNTHQNLTSYQVSSNMNGFHQQFNSNQCGTLNYVGQTNYNSPTHHHEHASGFKGHHHQGIKHNKFNSKNKNNNSNSPDRRYGSGALGSTTTNQPSIQVYEYKGNCQSTTSSSHSPNHQSTSTVGDSGQTVTEAQTGSATGAEDKLKVAHTKRDRFVVRCLETGAEEEVITSQKYLATIRVGIPHRHKFGVAKRIIGPNGCNMKLIATMVQKGGAKIRLRGEGFQDKDMHTPLQLNISSHTASGYILSKYLLMKLMKQIHVNFAEWNGWNSNLNNNGGGNGNYGTKNLSVVTTAARLSEHPMNPVFPEGYEANFLRKFRVNQRTTHESSSSSSSASGSESENQMNINNSEAQANIKAGTKKKKKNTKSGGTSSSDSDQNSSSNEKASTKSGLNELDHLVFTTAIQHSNIVDSNIKLIDGNSSNTINSSSNPNTPTNKFQYSPKNRRTNPESASTIVPEPLLVTNNANTTALNDNHNAKKLNDNLVSTTSITNNNTITTTTTTDLYWTRLPTLLLDVTSQTVCTHQMVSPLVKEYINKLLVVTVQEEPSTTTVLETVVLSDSKRVNSESKPLNNEGAESTEDDEDHLNLISSSSSSAASGSEVICGDQNLGNNMVTV